MDKDLCQGLPVSPGSNCMSLLSVGKLEGLIAFRLVLHLCLGFLIFPREHGPPFVSHPGEVVTLLRRVIEAFEIAAISYVSLMQA